VHRIRTHYIALCALSIIFYVGRGGSVVVWCLASGRSQARIPLWPPRRDLEQVGPTSSTMFCIAIASAPPSLESALPSLACTRKRAISKINQSINNRLMKKFRADKTQQ